MKQVKIVDLEDLPPYGRFTCESCGYTWEGKRPRLGERCPRCKGLWAKGRITTWLSQRLRQRSFSGCVLPIVAVLALIVCCWLCSGVSPRVQDTWVHVTASVVSWIKFVGSVLLSFASLSLASVVVFALLAASAFLVLFAAFGLTRHDYGDSSWELAWGELIEHGRLVGTIINLLSSLCALWIVSLIARRQPDYWDFGLQFVIALVIEYAIFRLCGGTAKTAEPNSSRIWLDREGRSSP